MKPYTAAKLVQALTSAVLGAKYNPQMMQFVPEDVIERDFANWPHSQIVEVIAQQSSYDIEILEGCHAELHVIFSEIESTTQDRDSYLLNSGKQAFCVNLWYVDMLARALAAGPNGDSQYHSLKHAMVAFQVGTYLRLCDGSPRAILVRNGEEA